jgi:hypothetical protein
MTFDRFLANPEKIRPLYERVPAMRGVRIRSVNLNWRGPNVTLRLDLPVFPEHPPQEWADAEVDTVQCQLRFLAANNISLSEWSPPSIADIETAPCDEPGTIRITATGEGITLSFTCSDSVLIGHLSAYRSRSDGTDAGRHLFLSRIDARRHTSLPGTDEKTFYERF